MCATIGHSAMTTCRANKFSSYTILAGFVICATCLILFYSARGLLGFRHTDESPAPGATVSEPQAAACSLEDLRSVDCVGKRFPFGLVNSRTSDTAYDHGMCVIAFLNGATASNTALMSALSHFATTQPCRAANIHFLILVNTPSAVTRSADIEGPTAAENLVVCTFPDSCSFDMPRCFIVVDGSIRGVATKHLLSHPEMLFTPQLVSRISSHLGNSASPSGAAAVEDMHRRDTGSNATVGPFDTHGVDRRPIEICLGERPVGTIATYTSDFNKRDPLSLALKGITRPSIEWISSSEVDVAVEDSPIGTLTTPERALARPGSRLSVRFPVVKPGTNIVSVGIRNFDSDLIQEVEYTVVGRGNGPVLSSHYLNFDAIPKGTISSELPILVQYNEVDSTRTSSLVLSPFEQCIVARQERIASSPKGSSTTFLVSVNTRALGYGEFIGHIRVHDADLKNEYALVLVRCNVTGRYMVRPAHLDFGVTSPGARVTFQLLATTSLSKDIARDALTAVRCADPAIEVRLHDGVVRGTFTFPNTVGLHTGNIDIATHDPLQASVEIPFAAFVTH
jgi:hypothetical protein